MNFNILSYNFEQLIKQQHNIKFANIFDYGAKGKKAGCWFCIFTLLRPDERCPKCNRSGDKAAFGLCPSGYNYAYYTNIVGCGAFRIYLEILGIANHADKLECIYPDENVEYMKGILFFLFCSL